MVKLETDTGHNDAVFYFHNMKDCEEFMKVFENHWCNVPWKDPIEKENFDEAEDEEIEAMDESPEKRAEDALHWGFSLVKFLHIDINDSQRVFVNSMIDELAD